MIIFLLLALLFSHPTKIYAETNRITVTPQVTAAKVGTQIPILIKVFDDTTEGAKPSQGEEVEIRLAQPSDTIVCLTENGRGPSNADGEVHASCNATKSGTYTIYAFSYGRGDQSKNISLTYTDTDPAATASATTRQVQQQNQPNSGAAATGNGLVEETLAPTPFLNGVASMNGQVAAAAVNAAREQQKTSDDADLLKTLIFITGAVILIIWSVYLIILQVSQSRKKKSGSNYTPL